MDVSKIKPGNQNQVNVFILAVKDQKEVYSYSKKTQALVLERIFSRNFPFCYGFIPRTHHTDGRILDAVVLTNEKLEYGTIAPAKPIGMFRLKNRIPEDVLIAVLINDKTLNRLDDIKEILKKDLLKYEDFLEDFKGKEVDRVLDSKKAKKAVQNAIELYEREFG